MNDFKTVELRRLGGPELRRFFEGGLAALSSCARALDGINVFPVPDGDTGTNMAATLAGALRNCPDGNLATVASALARGALMEARGNSGVILAQILAALASVFTGEDTDAGGWAAAWQEAARAAPRSVGAPVEGTILTVVRELAAGASDGTGLPLLDSMRCTARAADAAVARTTRLLPVLEHAEVVDAGGLGLALLLRGGLAAFTGEPPPSPESIPVPTARTRDVIASADFPRFCTELLLAGTRIERQELQQRLRRFGDSVDLTGSTDALHIHLHTNEPEALFEWAATVGTVSHRKVEDMEQQRSRFLAGSGKLAAIGWVAVAAGAGMRRLFENLPGAAGVIEPPNELAASVALASATELLLLANDPRHWAAAEAVAVASNGRPVRAVLTANVAAGIAAALAFDPAASLDDNAATMLEAARAVRTLEGSPEAIAERLDTLDGGFSLVTLYRGAGVAHEQAVELIARLQRRFPGIETEIVDGGQPDPPLLVALE